jgi:hypothetical protein
MLRDNGPFGLCGILFNHAQRTCGACEILRPVRSNIQAHRTHQV